MKEQEVEQILNDIRDMMSKSSRFQSVSGYSIIVVGLLAAVASLITALIIGVENWWPCSEKLQQFMVTDTAARTQSIAVTGLILFALSLLTVFFFASIKSKRHQLRFAFDKRMGQMLLDFFIPLVVGGVLSIVLVMQEHFGLTSSIMLVFYGLALVNCSHYTYPIFRYLGYVELLLGIIDCFTMSHALLIWFLGFSVAHIVFGIVYILLFDRKAK